MSKKNPNDATFRNINALKKQIAALKAVITKLKRRKAVSVAQ